MIKIEPYTDLNVGITLNNRVFVYWLKPQYDTLRWIRKFEKDCIYTVNVKENESIGGKDPDEYCPLIASDIKTLDEAVDFCIKWTNENV